MELEKLDLKALAKLAKQRIDELDNAEISCAIIGRSGCGKSSLINTIAGKRIAKVGSTETTIEAQSFEANGITYTDLPGCDTKTFKKEEYIDQFELQKYDFFILVTSDRVFETDLYLYDELNENLNKKCFVVRTKIDRSVEEEFFDNQLSEKEACKKIRDNLLAEFENKTVQVYLVSNRKPHNWDFSKLLGDISAQLKGVKREKFVSSMAPWSKEIIDKKADIAAEYAHNLALLSALNGMNPIPGIDVTVDISLMMQLVRKVNDIFAISNENLEFIDSFSKTPEVEGIKQAIIKLIAEYTVRESLVVILKRVGLTLGAKASVKFIPIIGSLVSAGLGYHLTTKFADEYIDVAKGLSLELLDAITQEQVDI